MKITHEFQKQQMRSIDFSEIISEFTNDFVGREWLLSDIDNFLSNTHYRSYIINGISGSGKSAALAYITQKLIVHAHHFCIANQHETLDPILFCQSIHTQLALMLPDFEIEIDPLRKCYDSPWNLMERLIASPLRVWSKMNPDTQIVIAVDNFDEECTLRYSPSIRELIENSFYLPPNIRWILTSENAELPDSTSILLCDNDNNRHDIQRYLYSKIDSRLSQRDDICEQLYFNSAGNMLYLKHILNELRIKPGTEEHIAGFDFPDSITDLYNRYTKNSGLQQSSDDILAVLSVACEPIPSARIADFTGVSQDTVEFILSGNPFLNKTELGYYISHKSYSDYLLNSDAVRSRVEKTMRAHRLIAGWYLDHFQNNWAGCDGYGLRYVAHHLAESQDSNELKLLLLEYSYIKAKVEGAELQSLIFDYNALKGDAALQRIGKTLLMSQDELTESPSELPSHLYGRLVGTPDSDILRLFEQIGSQYNRQPKISGVMDLLNDTSWLRPQNACLSSPDAFVSTIEWQVSELTAVAVTPDAHWAVMGSGEGIIRLCDLANSKTVYTLIGHRSVVTSLAISNDGAVAVSAAWDKTVRVWKLHYSHMKNREIQPVFTLEGHTDGITALIIDDKNSLAVTGSLDQTICIWDIKKGRLLHTLNGHNGAISAVAFTSNGTAIASGSYDGTVKIWDIETGTLLHTLTGHSDGVNNLSVKPRSPYLTSTSYDSMLRVWRIGNREPQHLCDLPYGWIAEQTPDGKYVISTGIEDKKLHVYEIETGEEYLTLSGHAGRINAITVTADSRQVISASVDNTIRVWDLETGEMLCSLTGHQSGVTTVFVSSDGNRIISGSQDCSLRIWNAHYRTPSRPSKSTRSYIHTEAVTDIVVTPDFTRAVTASNDHALLIWDVSTGEPLRRLVGHKDYISALTLNTDGSLILSGAADDTIRLWNMENGGTIQVMEGHKGLITSLAFTADSKYALSGSYDNTMRYWDVNTGEEIHCFRDHTDLVQSVAVSPNGLWAVSGGDDCVVCVWNLTTGEKVHSLKRHKESIRYVRITKDGMRVISIADDKLMLIRDLHTGQLLHTEQAAYFSITANGNRAVLGYDDGTLRIWDLTTGDIMLKTDGYYNSTHTATIIDVTEDAARVITGYLNNTINVIDLSRGMHMATFTTERNIYTFACINNSRFLAGDESGRVLFLDLID